MDLDLVIKILGWSMAIAPIVVFNVLSAYMVAGAAQDDEVIMGMLMAGLGSVGLGVAILLFVYLTNFSLNNFLGV
jgi:hypothetical protein